MSQEKSSTGMQTAAALLVALHGSGPSPLPPHAPFVPRQVTRVYTQRLVGSPDRILPLLTPQGEREWLERWDPTLVSAPNGLGPGTIFLTRVDGQPDTLWLQLSYDPARHHVRYIRVTPDSDVTELDVTLSAIDEGHTSAVVRYTYTGLTERGNALVESKTEEAYTHFMKEWERALNHYLTTGACLRSGG